MKDMQGRSIQTLLPLPTISLLVPSEDIRLPYKGTTKTTGDEQSLSDQKGKAKEGETPYSVKGKTDRGNALKMNGQDVKIEQDGTFTLSLHLNEGENVYLLEITNTAGYTRYTRLMIKAIKEKALQTTEKEAEETQPIKMIRGGGGPLDATAKEITP
jgi:hypothetical protein